MIQRAGSCTFLSPAFPSFSSFSLSISIQACLFRVYTRVHNQSNSSRIYNHFFCSPSPSPSPSLSLYTSTPLRSLRGNPTSIKTPSTPSPFQTLSYIVTQTNRRLPLQNIRKRLRPPCHIDIVDISLVKLTSVRTVRNSHSFQVIVLRYISGEDL